MTEPLLFSPVQIRDVTLKNRVVIAPMHQYSGFDGVVQDWHIMNVGRYAAGGAGMVFVESTKIERRGCGTIGDLGAWRDDHIPGLKRLADIIRSNGSVPAIQLGHSGAKARIHRPWEGGAPLTREAAEAEGVSDWDAWELVAPSTIAAGLTAPEPRALTLADIREVVRNWGQAVRRCHEAGYDAVEIHAAHGFLLHQFLSPAANQRTDAYGGSEKNRQRLVLEVVEEARRFWPDDKQMFMRLSVEDGVGFGPDQSVSVAKAVAPLGVDVVDCSSGGMTGAPVSNQFGYGYQFPYAERLKRDGDVMSMAVGLIVHADQAEEILQNGQADLIAIAREAMYNPNWPMDAAMKLGTNPDAASTPPPVTFWLDKRRESGVVTPSTFGAGINNLSTNTDR